MAVKDPWRASRPLDRMIVLLLLGVACAGLYWSLTREAGRELVVEQDGRVIYAAPLAASGQIEVPGPLGPTVIEVADDTARVVEASCPQRLCVAMGAIRRQGQVVACLPNRVLLRITGEDAVKGYDLLTQ